MKRTAFILAGLLVLLSGAVALAAIPSADGTIHGCRKNSNGTLRVIDAEAGQQCQTGETALTWYSAGATVPEANRAEQLRLVVTIRSPNFRDGERVTQAVATCPRGYKVVGGGWDGISADDSVRTSSPYRWTQGGLGTFEAWFVDLNTTGDPGEWNAVATCILASHWWQDGAAFQQPPPDPPYPGNP